MMEERYKIIAQDVDSEKDCGFNVEFDRSYSIQGEWPITNDAAIKAIEDAYDWYPTNDMNMDLEEGQRVGYLYVDEDGEYIRTEYEPEVNND